MHEDVLAEREEGILCNEMKRIQSNLNELDGRRNIAEVWFIYYYNYVPISLVVLTRIQKSVHAHKY